MPISEADLDYAYMAGIMDGEGCICVSRQMPRYRHDDRRRSFLYKSSTCYVLTVAVCMSDPAPPYMFYFEFGGSLKFLGEKRHMWRWGVSANDAVMVLRALMPYLKGKRAQAELAIKFQTERVNFAKAGRGNVISVEELSKREEIYQEMGRLKRPWRIA
jgi:hypothetical protein